MSRSMMPRFVHATAVEAIKTDVDSLWTILEIVRRSSHHLPENCAIHLIIKTLRAFLTMDTL